MMGEFVMDKKCVVCGAILKVKKSLQMTLDKKFKCVTCKSKYKINDTTEVSEYCQTCKFPLMENENINCDICKIKGVAI